MAYTVIRTDNMSGTVEAKNLVSLSYAGDIENGSVVAVGALLDKEREVREATAPAADADVKTLAIIATPELVKDKDYFALSDFINEEGDILRGYRLTYHDDFSITIDGFTAGDTPAVGYAVELDGTTKLHAVASGSETGNTIIGHIIAVEKEFYVIEIDY